MKFKLVIATLLTALLALPGLALAQQPTAPPPGSSGAPSTSPGQRGGPPGQRGPACWQKAGVSRAAQQQHREQAQQTRSQVEAVCRDSTLSETQKMAQIKEIRKSARQEAAGLVSPQQLSAIESCQRGGAAAGPHPPAGSRGGGPCEGIR